MFPSRRETVTSDGMLKNVNLEIMYFEHSSILQCLKYAILMLRNLLLMFATTVASSCMYDSNSTTP